MRETEELLPTTTATPSAALARWLSRYAGDVYVEYRAPSASANTYLVLAGLAAAGADGIKRELVLPAAKDPRPSCCRHRSTRRCRHRSAPTSWSRRSARTSWVVRPRQGCGAPADVAANAARFAATGLDHDAAVQESLELALFRVCVR